MEYINTNFIEIISLFLAVISIFIIIIYNFILTYNVYKNSSYYKITGNPYWKVFYNLGVKGEYIIYKNLSTLEHIGVKFLFNLYLPQKDGKTSEVDILVIHPKGLFVIESKNFSGWIFGDERQRQWIQTLLTNYGRIHKEYFYNPIFQNKTHIRALRSLIEDNIPIYSIIAFSDKCTLKKVTVNSNVLITQYNRLYYDLLNQIKNLPIEILNEIEIKKLYEKLLPYSQVTDYVKIQHIKNINLNLNNKKNYKVKRSKIWIYLIIVISCIIISCIFNTPSPEEIDLNIKEISHDSQSPIPETFDNPVRKMESLRLESLEIIDSEKITCENKKLEKKKIRQIKKEQKRQLKAERKQLKSEIKLLKKTKKKQEKFKRNKK